MDEDTEYTVKKYASYIPVSEDMLMDCGVLPDTRTFPKTDRHWPLHMRIKWRVSQTVTNVRLWLAEKIAGTKCWDDHDDW